MTVNFRPMKGKVLIEKHTPSETTASGLYLAEKARDVSSTGTIMAIGELEDKALSVGDTVVFGKYSGIEVTRGDKPYSLMLEEELLGVVIADSSPKGENLDRVVVENLSLQEIPDGDLQVA